MNEEENKMTQEYDDFECFEKEDIGEGEDVE